jgi:hypothetical protein
MTVHKLKVLQLHKFPMIVASMQHSTRFDLSSGGLKANMLRLRLSARQSFN